MGTNLRRGVGACFGAAALVLGGASLAWACTAQAGITGSAVEGQSAGPAGSQTTISVSNFAPGPVEVRWNSADGSVLATGNGPDFKSTITIPQVAEGVYYVVAVGRERQASMPFEVTSATAQQSGAGKSSATSSTGTGQNTASTSGDDQRQSSDGQASVSPRGGAVSSGPSGGNSVVNPAQVAPATDESVGSTPTETASRPASTVRQPGRSTANGTSVIGTSGPSAVGEEAAATPEASAPVANAVAGSTASGDLWSGFSAGEGRTPRGAALSDGPSTATTSTPLVAAGAFSVALAAMFGGFLAAEMRRRRVTAQ